MIPERLTFRLGDLRTPLAEACDKSGNTPSEEIRLRLARSLRVVRPKLPAGAAGHDHATCECVSCAARREGKNG